MRFLKSLVLAAALFMPFTAYAKNQDYAVLINGDYRQSSTERHSRNIDMACKCLQKEGYKNENIYVVSPGSSNYLEGTFANVEKVLDELAAKVDNTDVVLVYTTGHGGNDNGSDIELRKSSLSARELLSKLQKINAEYFIYIGDQCYSGGFVNELSNLRKVAAMSDMNALESALCEPYADEFWKYNQDLNRDGAVTLKEAHKSAAEKEIKEEESTPQFRVKGLPEDVRISRHGQIRKHKETKIKSKEYKQTESIVETLLRQYRMKNRR